MNSSPDRPRRLHSRRKHLEDLTRREAEGEDFWTSGFEKTVRVRWSHLVKRVIPAAGNVIVHARELILEDEGLLHLASPELGSLEDFGMYAMSCDDEMMPTVIEALAVALEDAGRTDPTRMVDRARYIAEVNRLLRESRISFEFVNGEMVAFSSQAMHADVVEPTLRLLASDGRWEQANAAFMKSLDELSRGDAGDAITDAGTALQEVLTALGCEGNALGPLIRSARREGLIKGHDEPLLESLDRAAQWVSADRSETGDAHKHTKAVLDDAWLMVHVVGAVILRLSRETPRP